MAGRVIAGAGLVLAAIGALAGIASLIALGLASRGVFTGGGRPSPYETEHGAGQVLKYSQIRNAIRI